MPFVGTSCIPPNLLDAEQRLDLVPGSEDRERRHEHEHEERDAEPGVRALRGSALFDLRPAPRALAAVVPLDRQRVEGRVVLVLGQAAGTCGL